MCYCVCTSCFKLHVTDTVLVEVGCLVDDGLEALVSKLRAAAFSRSNDYHAYPSADAVTREDLPLVADPTVHMVACMHGCLEACSSLKMQPTLALNLQARPSPGTGPPWTGSGGFRIRNFFGG